MAVSPLEFLWRAHALSAGMATLPKDEAQRVAAALTRWARHPIGVTNSRAAGICAIAMVMVLVATRQSSDPAAVVRSVAVLIVVLQSAVHVVSIGMLRGLIGLGVEEAHDALASYRDPKRISSLDVAMLWALVGLVAGLAD